MSGYLADASFFEVLLRVAVVLFSFAGVVLALALILHFLERDKWPR